MNEFSFDIRYKKGSEIPSDYLSRYPLPEVSEVNVLNKDLPTLQQQDPFFGQLFRYLTYGEISPDKQLQAKLERMAPECFFENGILWRRLERDDFQRTVLCVPFILAADLIKEAH
jgi:hypothetical protein